MALSEAWRKTVEIRFFETACGEEGPRLCAEGEEPFCLPLLRFFNRKFDQGPSNTTPLVSGLDKDGSEFDRIFAFSTEAEAGDRAFIYFVDKVFVDRSFNFFDRSMSQGFAVYSALSDIEDCLGILSFRWANLHIRVAVNHRPDSYL